MVMRVPYVYKHSTQRSMTDTYSAVSLLGCGGLPGEEDELGAVLFQALYIGLQGLR